MCVFSKKKILRLNFSSQTFELLHWCIFAFISSPHDALFHPDEGIRQDVTIPDIFGGFSTWRCEVSAVRRWIMIVPGLLRKRKKKDSVGLNLSWLVFYFWLHFVVVAQESHMQCLEPAAGGDVMTSLTHRAPSPASAQERGVFLET